MHEDKQIDNNFDYQEIKKYIDESESNFDVMEWLINILKYWKFIIVFLSTLVALIIIAVLMMPRSYETSIELGKAEPNRFSNLLMNGTENVTADELIKRVYDKLQSSEFLKKYLSENSDYFKEMFPEANLESDFDVLFNEFMKGIQFKIIEPNYGGAIVNGNFVTGAKVSVPDKFAMVIESHNEVVATRLLNNLIEYANLAVIEDLKQNQSLSIKSSIEKINRQLDLLQLNEKQKRTLLVEKLEADNAERIKELEYRKEWLVMQEKQENQFDIDLKIESNEVLLKKLNQDRELAIERAAALRKTQIAEAEKALIFAKKLNIDLPTKMEHLTTKKNSNEDPSETNINISSNQEVPLYLMGTLYLETFIETLKNIEDDSIYLPELADIDREIARVKNDIELERLQQREDYEKFIKELRDIDNEIFRIKNDVRIQILNERESDLPFLTEQVGNLQAELQELNSYTLNFEDVNVVTVTKRAIVSNLPVKPQRKLIVLAGGVASLILTLIIATILVNIDNRRARAS